MQTKNMEFVIEQAKGSHAHHKGADAKRFAKAVAESIEVGVVVPSILRAHLEEAGYSVKDDTAALAEYGFNSLSTLKRVIVTDKDGAIIAMGAAGDPGEALAHAALGWFREHPAPDADVPAGLGTAPKNGGTPPNGA